MTDQSTEPSELCSAVAALTIGRRAGLARAALLSAECLVDTPEGAVWSAVAGVIESPDQQYESALRAVSASLADDARRDLADQLRSARNLVAVSAPPVADLWDELRRVLLDVDVEQQEAAA